MASATIGIVTTRDIVRQILRHRSFSFQEFSQRYANPNDLEDSFVLREARWQDPKNRQNSIDIDHNKSYDRDINKEWMSRQQDVINLAKKTYQWAINNNIAKEQARAVLPEGNTMSRIYMKGTLRSWVHYMELRSGNGTQKEHMEVARRVAEAISKIFSIANEFVQE